MKKVIFAVFIGFLFSCDSGNKYEYWDISKFNLQPNALADKEEIKLIYSSRGPDHNPDVKYFFHNIVVSLKSGDTVNILTTADNGFTEENAHNTFNYFSPENPACSYMNSLETKDNMEELDTIIFKEEPVKVVRDSEFDYIADNQFPTVIGCIGTVTKNKTEE